MSKVQVRPMEPDDVATVQALLEKDHWPRRSGHGWQWALEESPARKQLQAPVGWVLTADGAVVGCLANVPHLYSWQGQPAPTFMLSCLGGDRHRR